MKTFAPGDRVFVKSWIGRDKAGTVDADHGDAVSVVVDGKKKAQPFERARVRVQPELRVLEGGPYRAPEKPRVAMPPPADPMASVRPRPWGPPPVVAPPMVEGGAHEAVARTGAPPTLESAGLAGRSEPAPHAAVIRPPPLPRAQLRAVPKPDKPDEDDAYKAFVRRHPCIGCNDPADDAHHWARRGQKGMGRKPSDYQTVPLCRRCHDRFHDTGQLPNRERDGSLLNAMGSRIWILAKQVDLLVAWIRILNARLADRRRA